MDDFDPSQDALDALHAMSNLDPTRAAPIEPSAAYRGFAGQIYEFHSALRDAGFDHIDATYLAGIWVAELMRTRPQ